MSTRNNEGIPKDFRGTLTAFATEMLSVPGKSKIDPLSLHLKYCYSVETSIV